MSYEPTNWKAGDTITSAKLNKLEQGVASNILVVNIIIDEENETETLDKTWQEIFDADFAVGVSIHPIDVMQQHKEYNYIDLMYNVSEGPYVVSVGKRNFRTDSADGYPVYDGAK